MRQCDGGPSDRTRRLIMSMLDVSSTACPVLEGIPCPLLTWNRASDRISDSKRTWDQRLGYPPERTWDQSLAKGPGTREWGIVPVDRPTDTCENITFLSYCARGR